MAEISVIVPAYKQEKTILKDIENIYAALKSSGREFEIIVVVDGFLDNTFSEAQKTKYENVHIVGYQENRGKGYAIKFGMTHAQGDIIAFIDAGMDINPKSITMLLEHMDWYDADIVVASKRHPVSKVNYPFLRKVYSWGYFNMVRILFGVKVSDTQAGLKAYKREVLKNVLPRLIIKEYAFDIEILAVARKLGYKRIFEAPVELELDFKDTRFGTLILFDYFIRKMLIDTLAVFYRMNILKYYDDSNSHNWPHSELKISDRTIKEKEHTPRFSIIITARKTNDYLIESVEHIKNLNYPNFEAIIILDELAGADFVRDERFKFIIPGEKGPGEKRNMGAEAATGEILVFLDDDAFPSKDWLINAAKIFKNKKVYALGAPATTPPDVEYLEKVSGKILESSIVSGDTQYRNIPMHRRMIDDYPTVNLFVRKSSFDAVGGFVTEFWPGEDTKLCLDLIKYHKRKFVYDPSPVAYHHRRKILIPYLKQISRYGQHRGQFARIFPETSRSPFYFVPTLFTLGLLLGPIFSYYFSFGWYFYSVIVVTYLFLALARAIRVFLDDWNPVTSVLVFIGVILTHIVYGINFMIGFVRRPRLKLRSFDLDTGNYLGG